MFDFLLPLRCQRCGRASQRTLCSVCLEPLRDKPRIVGYLDPLWQKMPIIATTEYLGSVSTALIAYKEKGALSLRVPLSEALTAGLTLACDCANLTAPIPKLLLVPVPSREQAKRVRGADVIADLTIRVAKGFRPEPCEAKCLLHLSRDTKDQARLTVAERRANMKQGITLRSHSLALSYFGREAILIDDVVTSGASLQASARALSEYGIHVKAAVVIAAAAAFRS